DTLPLAVDAPELPGNPRTRVESARAQRADEHPPGAVGGEVVEAERALDLEEHAGLALADVNHVLSRDDHASIRVQDEAADAPALRHDRRDRAVGRAAIDPTAQRVAEVEVAVLVDARRLDEAVAVRNGLHEVVLPLPIKRANRIGNLKEASMLELGLTAKRALVVGAGRGIGRACVLGLCEAGARVACFDVDAERGRTVAAEARAAGGEALSIHGDARRRKDVEDAVSGTVEAFGGIDVAIDVIGEARW